MANESRTGGQSRAATATTNEGNGAGVDSGQAEGYGFAWRTCGALKTAAELLEGVAQDWRDVANEATDGGDMVRRLMLSEPRADVELLRALAQALADTAGVHVSEGGEAGAVPVPSPVGCYARDQHTGRCCTRNENHAGPHLDGTAAVLADQADAERAARVPAGWRQVDGGAEGTSLDEGRPTLGAALREWARDAVAAYRAGGLTQADQVTRAQAPRIVEIARNPDPRD